MPIGLTAGHSLLIATGTNRNRIAAQTLPYNTAARNAFLRLCSKIGGGELAHSLIPIPQQGSPLLRETAILWAE
jgi:hypothetical protein